MKIKDAKYLVLQIRTRIFELNGTAFQSFFEKVMLEYDNDFTIVRPYGKLGDGGNDGFIRSKGIYYQVYSPTNPKEKLKEAADKLVTDFEKLCKDWEHISEIKEYYFVFNDKYNGTIKPLEEELSILKEKNKSIEFGIVTVTEFEKTILSLKEDSLVKLNFDIDTRNSQKIITKFFDSILIALEKEDSDLVAELLNYADSFLNINDSEDLRIKYEILKLKLRLLNEEVDYVLEHLPSLKETYINKYELLVFEMELFLKIGNPEKCNDIIQDLYESKIEESKLKYLELVHKYNSNEKVDLENVDELSFPSEERDKSNYYRIYSLFFAENGKFKEAISYINKAIKYNANRLSNYYILCSFRLIELENSLSTAYFESKADSVNKEFTKIEQLLGNSSISPRNRISLQIRKIQYALILQNFDELATNIEIVLTLITKCYFDKPIIDSLKFLLLNTRLEIKQLEKLIIFIKCSNKNQIEELYEVLFNQFVVTSSLNTLGRSFYTINDSIDYVKIIDSIEKEESDELIQLLIDKPQIRLSISNYLQSSLRVRNKVIDSLTNIEESEKDKLYITLYFDFNKFKEAYLILLKYDLDKLSLIESQKALNVFLKLNDTERIVTITKRLLGLENDKANIIKLKIYLYESYSKLEDFKQVITIGVEILELNRKIDYLNENYKINILGYLIELLVIRSSIDSNNLNLAIDLLEKYKPNNPSYLFKIKTICLLYIKSQMNEKAFETIIDAVKSKGNLTPKEFSDLYWLFTIDLWEPLNLELDSELMVNENSFIKLSGENGFFTLNKEFQLDATLITNNNPKYALLLNRRLKDVVEYSSELTSKQFTYKIEQIFTLEKYILWKSIHHFNELSSKDNLDGVMEIKVLNDDGEFDFENFISTLKLFQGNDDEILETYSKQHIPLGLLSYYRGGFIKMIGLFQNEEKGFIRCNSGKIDNMQFQFENALNLIHNREIPFCIDGTSALFLCESDHFEFMYNYFPKMLIPQSVVNMLLDLLNKMVSNDESAEYLSIQNNKLNYREVNKKSTARLSDRIRKCLHTIESNYQRIVHISDFKKHEIPFTNEMSNELIDAAIISRHNGLLLMTDDYTYPYFLESQFQDEKQAYFSSIVLFKLLRDNGIITFKSYLDFFHYLSSYRLWFLPFDSNDILNAIYDGNNLNIEGVNYFNFNFLLSNEYDISIEKLYNILGDIITFLAQTDVNEKDIFQLVITIYSKCQLISDLTSFKNSLLLVIRNKFQLRIPLKEKIMNIEQLFDSYILANE